MINIMHLKNCRKFNKFNSQSINKKYKILCKSSPNINNLYKNSRYRLNKLTLNK